MYRFRAMFPGCPGMTLVFRWEITLDSSTLASSVPCTDTDQLRMVGTMRHVINEKSNYEYPIVVHQGTGLLIVDYVEADELKLFPGWFTAVPKSARRSWLFSCPETMHVKLNYGFTMHMENTAAGLWFDLEGLDVEERHSYLVAHQGPCIKEPSPVTCPRKNTSLITPTPPRTSRATPCFLFCTPLV